MMGNGRLEPWIGTVMEQKTRDSETSIRRLMAERRRLRCKLIGLYDKPLLDELVEASKFGPLVRSLFEEFWKFGSDPIERYAGSARSPRLAPRVSVADTQTWALLGRIWTVYGAFSDIRPSSLAHAAGSPWEAAQRIRRSFLSNADLAVYFRAKSEKTSA